MIFLFKPPARAEDIPPNAVRLMVDFSKPGGLVDYYTSDNIPDNAAQLIYNIDFRRNGNLSTRKGVSTYLAGNNQNSYAGPYTANYISFFVSTRSYAYLVEQFHDNIEFKSAAPGAVVTYQTTDTGNDYIDGVNWNGTFYIIGHTNPPGGSRFIEFATDDIRQTNNLTGMPQGHMLQPHLDRLLISGSTTFPLRVFYSDANLPESFNAANTLDITGVREYDRVTGIGPTLLGSLPIYTKFSTRLLYGTVFPTAGSGGNTGVRVISENIGSVHHRTIKNMNNKQYFFSSGPSGTQPGIYVFNGITVKEATKAVRKLFEGINVTTAPLPNAFVYKDSYCLNVSTKNGLRNTQQICIDDNDAVRLSSFTVETTGEALGIDGVAIYNGETRAINGNNAASYKDSVLLYDYDSGSDSPGSPTQPIVWRYKTKDFAPTNDFKIRPKVPNRMYISSQYIPTSFSVTANYDFGRASTTWIVNSTTIYKTDKIQTVIKSSATMVNKLTFPGNIEFKNINFELTGSSYSSIDSIDFYAVPSAME